MGKKFLTYALLGLFLAAAPALFQSCSSRLPIDEGTVVVGMNGTPTNIDPRYATDAYSHQLIELCYNGVMKKDFRGRPVPDLAESVTSINPKTYLIRLKKGVTFHDGSPLTARDVAYTYEFLRDPANGTPHAGTFEKIEEIKIISDQVLQVSLKEPFAPFETALTVPIVREGTPKEALKNGENGTGPFRMVTFSPDQEAVFVPYEAYFESPPKVKKLVLRFVLDDNVRFLQLKKGEINLVINGVTPDLLDEIRKDGRFQVVESVGSNFSYLGFNLRDPILRKRKVREAIARGINRQEIIDSILRGLAVPGDTLISPLYWAHESDVPRYPYDPEKAKKLLDEAGFPDPDGDGPLPRFSITYRTSQNDLRRRIAQVIQEQLRRIGIDVKILSYEWGTFFSDIKRGNFQLYSLTWVGITDPDIYYYAFHSKSTPPAGANRNGYANPEVDRLVEEGRRVLSPAKRKEIYSRVQKIIARDLPIYGLWFSKNVLVADRRIRGFTLYPDESYRPFKDVWIEGQ
ncbi:MAG: ABC transporter substrate-binding protein [Deltaproteobacteria bacterium]|nr:MAG: ABC transporter substrate-binding protein [Deltaproteobacteria bacterium]